MLQKKSSILQEMRSTLNLFGGMHCPSSCCQYLMYLTHGKGDTGISSVLTNTRGHISSAHTAHKISLFLCWLDFYSTDCHSTQGTWK